MNAAAGQSTLLTVARWLVLILPLCMVGGRVAVDAALSLTAILFLVHSACARDWSWTRRTWFRLAVVLWLWMLLISLFAFEPRQSFSQALPWIRFLIFAAALEHWVLDEAWMRRLAWSMTAAVAFVAGDTWLQYLTGVDLFQKPRPDIYRLTGPFDDKMPGIFIAKMMFPVVLGALAWQAWQRNWAKGVFILMVTFFVGAVYVSGERMALLYAVAGLFLAAILQKGVLRVYLAGGLIAALLVGVVLSRTNSDLVNRHATQTVETIEDVSDSPYGQIWHSALHLAAERPLHGVGMKNFRIACHDPQLGLPKDVKMRCATHPHNIYLEFLVESGVPGLLLFIALVASWARRLLQGWREDPNNVWLLGPALALFVFLFPISTGSSFFSNWFGGIFWLCLGWALAAVRLRSDMSKAR